MFYKVSLDSSFAKVLLKTSLDSFSAEVDFFNPQDIGRLC